MRIKIFSFMTNINGAIWMFLLPLTAILFPLWLGQHYGRCVKKKSGEIHDAPIGSVVGATLGLLAFMLGFTFQIVGNRFDARKELYLNEISDIRTAYLYTGLVPEPIRSDARKMIVGYVDIRVKLLHDSIKFEDAKLRSQ